MLTVIMHGVHLGTRSGDASIRPGWFAVRVVVSEEAYGYRGGYTAYRSAADVLLGSQEFTDDMLRPTANPLGTLEETRTPEGCSSSPAPSSSWPSHDPPTVVIGV
jgi:hypothetical protein